MNHLATDVDVGIPFIALSNLDQKKELPFVLHNALLLSAKKKAVPHHPPSPDGRNKNLVSRGIAGGRTATSRSCPDLYISLASVSLRFRFVAFSFYAS